MPEFVSNEQIVQAARRRLGQGAWDYLAGGSESETTLRRNRLAFDRWALRPRVLTDVSHIEPSTTLMGLPLRIPVVLAPVGSMQVFDPDGAATSGIAAGEYGTLQVVSSASEPSIEDVAAASKGPKVYQLYIRGDWPWIEDTVARIREAGYIGFCLTVDTAVPSRRDRTILSGFVNPGSRNRGGQPGINYASMVTWEMMARIKELAGLPFMLKGVARADDARLAVEHGVDVVWVSNHGGRQLDHGLGSVDMLPEIVEAVDGRAEVILDGGVQRGSDIIKAIALGAKAVAIGRLQAWGMAADGKDGIVRVLELLEDEIRSAMGLMGVTKIGDVTRDFVQRARPVTPPHEMSAWANMSYYGKAGADGRIL
jgi:glycolate oxidase